MYIGYGFVPSHTIHYTFERTCYFRLGEEVMVPQNHHTIAIFYYHTLVYFLNKPKPKPT